MFVLPASFFGIIPDKTESAISGLQETVGAAINCQCLYKCSSLLANAKHITYLLTCLGKYRVLMADVCGYTV